MGNTRKVSLEAGSVLSKETQYNRAIVRVLKRGREFWVLPDRRVVLKRRFNETRYCPMQPKQLYSSEDVKPKRILNPYTCTNTVRNTRARAAIGERVDSSGGSLVKGGCKIPNRTWGRRPIYVRKLHNERNNKVSLYIGRRKVNYGLTTALSSGDYILPVPVILQRFNGRLYHPDVKGDFIDRWGCRYSAVNAKARRFLKRHCTKVS